MTAETATIFLCGDVMTGRGIDQILPHPSPPQIYEPYLTDARGYLHLAERALGPIPAPVDFPYPWGDALAVLEQMAPDLRIINLETSITTSEEYWKGKGINYRMNPANTPCLTAARVDACALANNHVLDWGYPGLAETLSTLRSAGIQTAGAGCNLAEAEAPATLEVPGKGRVHLFSFAFDSSGVPGAWAATSTRAGVNYLDDLSPATVARIAAQVEAVKSPGDAVIVSVHWGGNWGYEVTREERLFARGLIDDAGADIVYGHSSHHVKGVEWYHDRLVMYGCGDLLNDYEGIRGYQEFRGDLGLMYFPEVELGTGKVVRLTMVPTRIRGFRIERAGALDTEWLGETLSRECARLGSVLRSTAEGTFELLEL